MYSHLEKTKLDKDNMLIYQPSSTIEKRYANQLTLMYSLLLEEEDNHQRFLDEQQLLISHAVHQMKTPVSIIQLIVQASEMNSNNLLDEWYKVKSESDKINFSLNQLLSYSRSNKLISDLKIESFII